MPFSTETTLAVEPHAHERATSALLAIWTRITFPRRREPRMRTVGGWPIDVPRGQVGGCDRRLDRAERVDVAGLARRRRAHGVLEQQAAQLLRRTAVGATEAISAATPATCGAAIDVPERVS